MNVNINDVNYKFNADRTDPEEFRNRLNNYKSCVMKFLAIYPTVLDLKNQLKRTDIDRLCVFELMALRKFADDTDFGYENFYHKIDPYLKIAYETATNRRNEN